MTNASKQAVRLHAVTQLAKYEVIEETQLKEAGDTRISHITEAIGPEDDHVEGSMSRREKLQQLVKQKEWSHLSQEQKG